MLDALLSGLSQVLQPEALALMAVGVCIGLVVGVLPGLGGSVTLALMLPFTFDMEPVQAFAFLLGMWVVSTTAGDITSILFGIPGEATSAAMVLDGYPLSRKGEAGRALGAALSSSLAGGLVGAIVLAATIPLARPIVLAFGPPHFFMLTVLGLSFVVSLSGSYMLKGAIMAVFGIGVALIGADPQAGIPRYTFGQLYLWDGVGLVPLVVGLFGGAEVLQLMLGRKSIATTTVAPVNPYAGVLAGMRESFKHLWCLVRSAVIGVGVGVIPGLGGSVAQFISYGIARQSSARPEDFGKGSIEGVVASGATNNAKDGGSLIPTVAFGIPGSVSTAVLLGAFLIAGLNPGPEMLTTELDITFSMVWIVIIANVLAVVLGLLVVGKLVRLTHLQSYWLVPGLLILLTVGSYTSSNNGLDVVVMVVASIFGVVAIRWNWPRVPFLLAVVLGGLAERYFFLSHSLTGWQWLLDPGVLLIASATVLALALPRLLKRRRDKRKESVMVNSGGGE